MSDELPASSLGENVGNLSGAVDPVVLDGPDSLNDLRDKLPTARPLPYDPGVEELW